MIYVVAGGHWGLGASEAVKAPSDGQFLHFFPIKITHFYA